MASKIFSPGEEFPAHWHDSFDEGFAVISGSMEIEIDGSAHQLNVGEKIIAERSQIHALRNPGTSPAEILIIKAPVVEGDIHWVN